MPQTVQTLHDIAERLLAASTDLAQIVSGLCDSARLTDAEFDEWADSLFADDNLDADEAELRGKLSTRAGYAEQLEAVATKHAGRIRKLLDPSQDTQLLDAFTAVSSGVCEWLGCTAPSAHAAVFAAADALDLLADDADVQGGWVAAATGCPGIGSHKAAEEQRIRALLAIEWRDIQRSQTHEAMSDTEARLTPQGRKILRALRHRRQWPIAEFYTKIWGDRYTPAKRQRIHSAINRINEPLEEALVHVSGDIIYLDE